MILYSILVHNGTSRAHTTVSKQSVNKMVFLDNTFLDSTADLTVQDGLWQCSCSSDCLKIISKSFGISLSFKYHLFPISCFANTHNDVIYSLSSSKGWMSTCDRILMKQASINQFSLYFCCIKSDNLPNNCLIQAPVAFTLLTWTSITLSTNWNGSILSKESSNCGELLIISIKTIIKADF